MSHWRSRLAGGLVQMKIKPETGLKAWVQLHLVGVCVAWCGANCLGVAAYLIFGLR